MALTGMQKAAMVLMSLDAVTAAELVKGLDAQKIEEIAMELAQIEASKGRYKKVQAEIAREFCNSLQREQTRKFSVHSFLNEILTNVLDKNRVEKIQSQIANITETKDIFVDIRLANTDELVLALEGQHPQAIAIVLAELPPKKSQEILGLLRDEARLKAVCRMANPELIGSGVKQRVRDSIIERLDNLKGKGETLVKKPEETLRKIAIMLNGLEKELRDQFIEEIAKDDEETAATVRRLMVTWEDIPLVADRSLQESLRTVDASKLAVAIYGADEDVIQKIRSNMSDRAAAKLDEEASLMQEPMENEILEAREEVVTPLREANEEGKLRVAER
jgi:flagellar motor switch protein FliG